MTPQLLYTSAGITADVASAGVRVEGGRFAVYVNIATGTFVLAAVWLQATYDGTNWVDVPWTVKLPNTGTGSKGTISTTADRDMATTLSSAALDALFVYDIGPCTIRLAAKYTSGTSGAAKAWIV